MFRLPFFRSGQDQGLPVRPIILLQGPVSGFFGGLSRFIEATSAQAVLKIDFNLGDVLSDSCTHRRSYLGHIDDLEDWYRDLFTRCRPRAVVVFGDQRPVHVRARRVCDELGIPFFSFEEGYVRPDFVTLEKGGNNANSPLPKDGDTVVPTPPPTTVTHYGANFAPMAIHASKYYCMFWAGRAWFVNNVHHRNQSLRLEISAWVKAFTQKFLWRTYEKRLSEQFCVKNSKKYFIIALQKYDDSQIHFHGRGWNAERLITEGIASFAAHAPADMKLVIKQHPLNTGYRSYTALVRDTARRHGISDRLLYLQNGNLLELLNHAHGLVTINSTIGLSAMGYACPVMVFGDAFYAMPGLAVEATGAESLHPFWSRPPPVNMDLYRRFRSFIIATTQLNGDFYLKASWPMLCKKAFERLMRQSE